MWMNDEPVFVPFISFLDSVLLTDIWCKFMLKNGKITSENLRTF